VSRILRRARTSRLARVGSGSRNTAAIWAGLRPQTARSVSATRTCGSSEGWQHKKISASCSCGAVAPATSGGPLGRFSSRTAAASFWVRRACRRSASSALCRAVPISQACGFGGTPDRGQDDSATRQASCTASSAAARSPVARVTPATAAHQCERSTRSTEARSTAACAVRTRPQAPVRRLLWLGRCRRCQRRRGPPPTRRARPAASRRSAAPGPGRRSPPACSRRPAP
jgi:hypothetical protein